MAIALQKFSCSGPAGHLEGIAHIPDRLPRALAVIAHPLPTMGGTMENKVAVTLAKTFAELGCVTLRFNFRGVGASAGEFTGGAGETEDMSPSRVMRGNNSARSCRYFFPDFPLADMSPRAPRNN